LLFLPFFLLFILLPFFIFLKKTKLVLSSIPISTFFFVNNRLLISQEKAMKNQTQNSFVNTTLYCFLLLNLALLLSITSQKSFYFLRSINIYILSFFGPPSIRRFVTLSERYLGFFFDIKLSFQQHIHYYANKALFTIKNMKMLGNSKRKLFPIYKQLLYRTCVLSIALYGSHCGISKKYHYFTYLKNLRKYKKNSTIDYRSILNLSYLEH